MTGSDHERRVLVTGGGGGIGRATAIGFAERGAAVVVAGRDGNTLAETVDLMERIGGSTYLGVVADVGSEAEVEGLISEVTAELGGLDVAVNNAGVGGPVAPITEIDADAWNAVLQVNVTGVWHCLKHEMRYMRDHGGGAIINVGSIIGPHSARPSMAAYGATKAAVVALTKAAALEGVADRIRVNSVSPGASETKMSLRPGETEPDRDARIAAAVPLGRLGTMAELASAIGWLADERNGFAVGLDLVLDGGASL